MMSITDSASHSVLVKVSPKLLTGVAEGEELLFFDQGVKAVLELVFPSVEAAGDAFHFSLDPPVRGFMQLASFLHSIAAFHTGTMEVMMYLFIIPSSETKVTAETI
jgi:hypothetical protein